MLCLIEAGGQRPSHCLDSRQATVVRPGWLVVPAGDSHPDDSTLSAQAVVEQFLLIGCCSSAFGEAARGLPMITYKHNESRLLNGRQCSYFVIVAILLTFIHKCKPYPRQPLAEGGVSHGHFRCGRPSSRNKDAFGRDDSIPIIASNIDLSCIGLAFAFFNTTEESSKLRQRWGAEVTDLVGKGFRRDVLLGVDHCREIIKPVEVPFWPPCLLVFWILFCST